MTRPRKPAGRTIAPGHVEIRLRGSESDVDAALVRLSRTMRVDWAGEFRDDGKSGRRYVAATVQDTERPAPAGDVKQ